MGEMHRDTPLDVKNAADGKLPWHRPEITRLTVTLDTRFNVGTFTDGHSGSTAG